MTAILPARTGTIKKLSALTKWPGIDKRATGGLNETGTKPQTSVSLWNQRKHSGYKLKNKQTKTISEKTEQNKTKKKLERLKKNKTTLKRQQNTKHRDQALVFVNLYFLQKWQ